MNENFQRKESLAKVSIWETSENLTACWEITKIVHTLLIVLLTLIPRHSPGNETKFCHLVSCERVMGTEQDHTALPGSTASHG